LAPLHLSRPLGGVFKSDYLSASLVPLPIIELVMRQIKSKAMNF